MKLVREHINEKFTQDSDPISDMGIGMMYEIKQWMKSIREDFIDKDNALCICSEYGKTKFIKYLLDIGSDVHANNDEALKLASSNGYVNIVKMLLAAGTDVHADNDDQALRYASYYGYSEIVKLLLDAGANVHANDDEALRWASDNKQIDVIKLLQDHIAKEKKIRESVNEKFTEDSDPIYDMGIGKKKLIEEWLEKYNITRYKINSDFTIDVYDNVNLYSKDLENFPEYIQFNVVNGSFGLNNNKFTTLKGCPKKVRSWFSCNSNRLKNLDYAPEDINITLFCSENSDLSFKEIYKYAKRVKKKNNSSNIHVVHNDIHGSISIDGIIKMGDEIKECLLPLYESIINEEINVQKIKDAVSKLKNKSVVLKSLVKKFNDTKDLNVKNYLATILVVLYLSNFAIHNSRFSNVTSLSKEVAKETIITIDKLENLLNSDKLSFIDYSVAKASIEAVELIKEHEKLSLTAYSIGDGKITIGYGHAYPEIKSPYKVGDKITKERAEKLLNHDVHKAENSLKRKLAEWEEQGINVNLDQSMFDACVSMIFNIGMTGFLQTEFVQHLKNNDYYAAAEKIKTTKISSKFPGLIKRRHAESELFSKNI